MDSRTRDTFYKTTLLLYSEDSRPLPIHFLLKRWLRRNLGSICESAGGRRRETGGAYRRVAVGTGSAAVSAPLVGKAARQAPTLSHEHPDGRNARSRAPGIPIQPHQTRVRARGLLYGPLGGRPWRGTAAAAATVRARCQGLFPQASVRRRRCPVAPEAAGGFGARALPRPASPERPPPSTRAGTRATPPTASAAPPSRASRARRTPLSDLYLCCLTFLMPLRWFL